MKIEELKIKLRALILEVKPNNFNEYYSKFEEVIEEFKNTGGLGKPVYEYIIKLANEFGETNIGREEILVDTLNRLVCWCPPRRHLKFDDFDIKNNKWK